MALSTGREVSRGQIFKSVGWRRKEPSVILLASYEAVSTIVKVQDSGISLIKVTNRKLFDKNK